MQTSEQEIIIEHPAGEIATSLIIEHTAQGVNFPKASFIRTARPLFDGYVFVPHLNPGSHIRTNDN